LFGENKFGDSNRCTNNINEKRLFYADHGLSSTYDRGIRLHRQARKIGSSSTIVTAFSLRCIFIRTWFNNFDMDQARMERFLPEYEGAD